MAPADGFGPQALISVFEFNSLAAILVYALIAWVLVKIVSLVLGDSRRGVRTTTSSHTDLA